MPVGGMIPPPNNMGNNNNPHNLPPPPSGPPMMGGGHRGGGGMGRSPFTNTILITNMPPFFIGYQQVRDWLYPCGTAKTCLFYPRVPKRKNNNNNNDDVDNKASGAGDIEMIIANEGGEVNGNGNGNESNNKKTVLINMINPDQALKVVASFKTFVGQLDDRYKDIRCYMVPSSPDIPLPPPLMDETTKKVLGEKLWHNFISLETSYSDSDNKNSGLDGAGSAGANKTTPTTKGDAAEESDNKTNDAKDNSNNTTSPSDDKDEPKLLDADKVAAAAGGVGTYDADEDPLNAPQVLEAVKEFRRKLDRTHGSQKTQRMDLVAKKLKELRPRIRAQVDAEKTNRLQNNNHQRLPGALPPLPAPPQHTSLPQPPLPPGGPVPPPLGLPPPPAAADSGKRGRSNLPAWMTKQQQQQQTSAASDEPASKKARTEQYPTHFPSALPPSSHPVLRQFLANQVKESMGEEEATLIDFLYTHILQGKATSELLQELQVVLEEEADGFLKAVWTKVQEIQQQQ
jgi:hypothetical protein